MSRIGYRLDLVLGDQPKLSRHKFWEHLFIIVLKCNSLLQGVTCLYSSDGMMLLHFKYRQMYIYIYIYIYICIYIYIEYIEYKYREIEDVFKLLSDNLSVGKEQNI